MGSYGSLKISGVPVLHAKNTVDTDLISLFTQDDLVIETTDASGDEADERWASHISLYAYQSYTAAIQDRLHLIGLDLSTVRDAFDAGCTKRIEELTKIRDQVTVNVPDSGDDLFQERIDVLESLSFDKWCKATRHIISQGIERSPTSRAEYKVEEPEVRYALTSNDRYLLGFPSQDYWISLYALINCLDSNTEVTYDLTDLVHGGYLSPDEHLVRTIRDHVPHKHPLSQPTIVLTEGRTDRRILSAAIRIRRPHLADFFSFMDFKQSRSPGGTGELVRMIKAFIGAGIANRTVALFDNDTAGWEARRALEKLSIPDNIRICSLPPIPLGDSYPTLGPQGVSRMNVNGLAGSIELYLGKDILKNDSDNFTPVQWTGYSDSLGQYQGELLHKRQIRTKFFRKIDAADHSHSSAQSTEGHDWSGIDEIISVLVSAFNGSY